MTVTKIEYLHYVNIQEKLKILYAGAVIVGLFQYFLTRNIYLLISPLVPVILSSLINGGKRE